MLYRTLPGTGVRVSVLGLGTGTRFGDARRNPPPAAARLVRAALDLGINYIDTASGYGDAETLLGGALAGLERDQFILATKFFPMDPQGSVITPAQLRLSVEQSLRRLRLETVDVLQIHGLRPHWLEPVMTALGTELSMLRQEGKYRWLGVSETIVEDPRHDSVPRAVTDSRFATALVAYHALSPWAELTALPACEAHHVGVIGMVAVGKSLREPATLERLLRDSRARGEQVATALPVENPLEWLRDAHSPTLAAAGLRFAASHPAVSCVLAGTLNPDHLRENAVAVTAPPFAEDVRARVRELFLHTDPAYWRPCDV